MQPVARSPYMISTRRSAAAVPLPTVSTADAPATHRLRLGAAGAAGLALLGLAGCSSGTNTTPVQITTCQQPTDHNLKDPTPALVFDDGSLVRLNDNDYHRSIGFDLGNGLFADIHGNLSYDPVVMEHPTTESFSGPYGYSGKWQHQNRPLQEPNGWSGQWQQQSMLEVRYHHGKSSSYYHVAANGQQAEAQYDAGFFSHDYRTMVKVEHNGNQTTVVSKGSNLVITQEGDLTHIVQNGAPLATIDHQAGRTVIKSATGPDVTVLPGACSTPDHFSVVRSQGGKTDTFQIDRDGQKTHYNHFGFWGDSSTYQNK